MAWATCVSVNPVVFTLNVLSDPPCVWTMRHCTTPSIPFLTRPSRCWGRGSLVMVFPPLVWEFTALMVFGVLSATDTFSPVSSPSRPDSRVMVIPPFPTMEQSALSCRLEGCGSQQLIVVPGPQAKNGPVKNPWHGKPFASADKQSSLLP